MPNIVSKRNLSIFAIPVFILLIISILPPVSGQDTTEAGNITFLDISAQFFSDCWAGYYGRIFEGSPSSPTSINAVGGTVTELDITLDCSPINNSNYLLISESSTSPSLPSLTAGNIFAINAIVGNGTDSGNNTFRYMRSYLIAGDYTIDNVSTFYPYINESAQNESFEEGFLNDSSSDDMVFAVSMTFDTWGFNNQTQDYQMVLPTPCGGNKTYYIYVDTCIVPRVIFEEEEVEAPKPGMLRYYILAYPELPVNITPERVELIVDMVLHRNVVKPTEELPGTLYFNYTGNYSLSLRVVLTIKELELYQTLKVELQPYDYLTKNFSFIIPLDAENGFYNVTAHFMWGDRRANLSGVLTREFAVWTPPRVPPSFRIYETLPMECNCFLIACSDVFTIIMILIAFSAILIAFASLWKHEPISIQERRHYSVYIIFILSFSPVALLPIDLCLALILSFVDIIVCIMYYLSVVPIERKKPKRKRKKRRKRRAEKRGKLTFATFSGRHHRSP